MSPGSGELIAADESTVIPKPCLDVIVVGDRDSDGRLSYSPCAYRRNRPEPPDEPNNLLNELVERIVGAATGIPRGIPNQMSTEFKCGAAIKSG